MTIRISPKVNYKAFVPVAGPLESLESSGNIRILESEWNLKKQVAYTNAGITGDKVIACDMHKEMFVDMSYGGLIIKADDTWLAHEKKYHPEIKIPKPVSPSPKKGPGFEAQMLRAYAESIESGKPFYFCEMHEKIFNDIEVGGTKIFAVDSYYNHKRAHGMDVEKTPGVQ